MGFVDGYYETEDVRKQHTDHTRTSPVRDGFIRLQTLRDQTVTAGHLANGLRRVHHIF